MSFLVHLAFFAGWVGSKIAFPSSWVSSGIGAVWLVLFLSTTLYFAVFSWKRRASPLQSLGYGIVAAIHYPEFLWKLKPRLDLSWEEKKQLLALSPAITHVSRPSSLLCPFCKIEIEHILVALPGEGIGVQKRPVLCPRCQTRLDCCRFCVFFEPRSGRPLGWGEDLTSGRCTRIKKHQSVDEICSPSVARKLKEMGWHTLYAGLAIPDSFSPPDECRTFQFDERKTLLERLPCMGKERALLLRLEATIYSQPSSSSRSG
jgi:hypothetical protein